MLIFGVYLQINKELLLLLLIIKYIKIIKKIIIKQKLFNKFIIYNNPNILVIFNLIKIQKLKNKKIFKLNIIKD